MASTQKSSICLKHGACSEYHEDGDLSGLGWQCYVHFQSLLEESLVDCMRRDVDDALASAGWLPWSASCARRSLSPATRPPPSAQSTQGSFTFRLTYRERTRTHNRQHKEQSEEKVRRPLLFSTVHSSCQSYSITVLCIARKRCTRTPCTFWTAQQPARAHLV